MIRLRQTFGAHAGRSYAFQQAIVRIGRMPDSDICFDAHADLDASGRHAEIRREGNGWILHDVGSRNGTFVNGQRVTRHALQDKDEVEFGSGGPRLVVELVAAVAPSVMPRPAPVAAGAQTAAATPASKPPPPMAPPMARPDARTMAATPSSKPPPPSAAAEAAGAAPLGARQDPISGDAATMLAPPKPAAPAASPAPPAASPAPGPAPAAATPSPAPPGAGPEGEPKLYGKKTVGEMVIKAVQEAQAQQPAQSFRGLKIAVAVLAVLLVVAVAAVSWIALRRSGASELDPGHVTAANAGALFRLTAGEEMVCSAFAVSPGVLATTARCAETLEARRAAGSSLQAWDARSGHAIGRVYRHPGHQDGQSAGPNVGLVEVQNAPPGVVTLAPVAMLDGLEPGSEVLAFGYAHGTARSQLSTLEDLEGIAGGGRLLHHDASATEGAALFDASGTVIGVHVVEAAQLEGPGHAVGADLIAALLAGMR